MKKSRKEGYEGPPLTGFCSLITFQTNTKVPKMLLMEKCYSWSPYMLYVLSQT